MKTAYLMADDKTYPFVNKTYRGRILAGMCGRCGKTKAAPNARHCTECAGKNDAYNAQYYAKKKAERFRSVSR